MADVLRERIRRLVVARGLTPAEFSAAAGKSPSWATGYLKGGHDIPISRIGAIAKALGVTPIDLVDERGLRPIADLDDEDLVVARAYHDCQDTTIKRTVRNVLELKNESRVDTARPRARKRKETQRPNDRDEAAAAFHGKGRAKTG